MESKQDIEMISQAIQKPIQDKRIKATSSYVKLSHDDDEQQLLSRLLSQLESLRESEQVSSPVKEEETCPRIDKAEPKRIENGGVEEEIMKELKAVKRQNTITHCLLSALILVTVIWELSEVSLFLKLRNRFNHPFRSLGSILFGTVFPSAGDAGFNVLDGGDEKEHHHHHHVVHPLLPSVRIPELSHVEFPHIGSNGEGH